jgi:hypothetical protein
MTDERTITVDAEHFGVRFVVPVLTLGLTLLAHILGMRFLGDVLGEGINPACIVLPMDLVLFLGLGYLIETTFKRAMPSQRQAQLSDDAVVLTDQRPTPPASVRIDWDDTFNVQTWRFEVRRRTRIPKGWYCMAVHLLQDEEDAIFYSFMSPEDAETMPGYDNFVQLRPRKETESNTDLSAVARQKRLLKLEDARWENGAEIKQDDFHALLAMIARKQPGWA